LLYSLRSVQKFLPWINHIYIITNDQVPSWLDVENPRITIIDHRDIVPAEYLPTFNSLALTLFLHRIPGLSEHFILSSDDMLVGAPLNPDFFFNASGDPIVILRERWYANNLFSTAGGDSSQRYKTMIGTTVRNGIRLAFELTGRRYYMVICHAMEAMRKSYLEDIMAKHGDRIIPRTATPCRNEKNIQRIFYPLYNHSQGRTEVVADWHLGSQRVRLSSGATLFGILWRAFLWMLPFSRHDYIDVKSDVFGKVSRLPALFNINSSTLFEQSLGDMEKLFPQKPEFEKR
jgi:hypothetical protein